jgi:hypothetical protein
MSARLQTFTDDREPAEVLFNIAKSHGWNEEDIVLLSKLTPDDYYTMFKTLRGLKLRTVGKKALELGNHGATIRNTKQSGTMLARPCKNLPPRP